MAEKGPDGTAGGSGRSAPRVGTAGSPGGSAPRADTHALLDEAALAAAGDVAPGGKEHRGVVGDVRSYLHGFYRHVAPDELAAAGPQRLAAIAVEQAAFAAHRPQGRALVRVRRGAAAACNAARDVVDIVTDDMPFLVDSVRMELARHGVALNLVVHPQFWVRRDVAGTLREVVGLVEGQEAGAARDEIAESWTHIEIARLPDGTTGAFEALESDLQRVLGDVRVAVEDSPRMQARAVQLAVQLAEQTAGSPGGGGTTADSPAEIQALLRWLADGHFTFLGYREYDLEDGPEGMVLRPVAGTGLGILRHDRHRSSSFAALAPEVRARARDPQLLIVTKANSRATVHRPRYLDYIAVKRLDGDGKVTGEHRFLGLYAPDAYTESITRIPVLRRRLTGLLAVTGIAPDSYDGKDLAEFLESYPREELFQTPVAQLADVAEGVLALRERPRTRLFLRKDIYRRYMSFLVYLPRDRYTTSVRLSVQQILADALGGAQVDYSVMVGESAVARLHVVVRAERGSVVPDADAAELEARIAAAVRSWDDDLAEEACRQLGEARAAALLAISSSSRIPPTYKADVPASAAVDDLQRILRLRESADDIAFELGESEGYRGGAPALPGDAPRVWRLTIFRTGFPLTLSDVLPRLQHMGVEVVDEHPYEFAAAEPFWIYDFGLRTSGVAPQPIEPVRDLVADALAALWRGDIEDDGFNALVLAGHLSWRQVAVLRGYAKYLRQTGSTFSQNYVERVLCSNIAVTRLLVWLFESRFDPERLAGEAERTEAITEEIRGELDDVDSLDEDRILRAYLGLILATLRTNYFAQQPRPALRPGTRPGAHSGAHAEAHPQTPYLVVKLDAARLPDLPEPRPAFELFVYSPRFEAVHIRFAPVARGGIRWSDRREDFRTEILGLAKAQEVKNAVIVPSGAKGGFVCKRLPDPADREAYQAEVLACYQCLISAMLDVTDNIDGGHVMPPARVVRRDPDDPYLAVAADKGTATFSDTANEIAKRRGFWLGDAFASGGSEGYDHKKMGITARGAWESVRFHFQGLGIDVDRCDFTVAGIGDMSGDVFGNGMLLSPRIRLVAAFDHRHVFVDPDPDPAVSFAERQRLFALPRSSWEDYDPSVISAGGGVWPRTAKSVPVSPQARAALGLDDGATALSPDQLISAVLRAPVDLLWNGGIGTYVKATGQANADVEDRSNDAVRVDASQLRARVVGEGGNLGLTQEARVEYALGGGLVNTDFIDNSAGVDTSDHEVNIKILLDGAVRDGELAPDDRGALLHEMTGEVAALVLRHNYQQNRALAASRAQATPMLHVHTRYIRKLERDGRINRRLDGLPGEKEIAERRSAGGGLTQPEFCVLLAQTKIAVAQEVLASSLPDDLYLRRVLADYFPAPLRERYSGRMRSHPLHREIITTAVVNDMVDRSGTTFAFRLNEETGASVPDITAAWLVARDVFDMAGFWAQVEALDGTIEPATAIQLLLEGRKLTERAARWLLHNRRPPFAVQPTIDFFADGVLTVAAGLPKLLTGSDLAGFDDRRDSLQSRGVPVELAERVAAMVPAYSAFDIVNIAAVTGRPVDDVAEVYFDLADRLQITRLRDRITALPREDRWTTMARGALRDDLYGAQASLTAEVLHVAGPGSPEQRLAAWVQRNDTAVRRAAQTLAEIWETDRFTVATLSVAVRTIRTLVSASALPG
jgi:glutamate dehydrogenase